MYITVSDISTLHLFSIGRHLTFKLLVLFWQLLDLPGIIEGAKDGKGRGRQVQTYCPLFFAVFLWFFFFFFIYFALLPTLHVMQEILFFEKLVWAHISSP